MAALWSCSLGTLIGIAVLLSDSPAGLVRAVWPREAVDWLAVAALTLTLAAQLPKRPVKPGRTTLVIGVLLGILIACRLLYGSVYLRPGNTSPASLMAIAISGMAIGLVWHLELIATENVAWSNRCCVWLLPWDRQQR